MQIPAYLPVMFAAAMLWYSAPLVVAVSLVCAATRQEFMQPILSHAARFAVWIVVFMGLFMALISLLQWLA
ncbi:MAG: hypothetical protein KDA44_19105 [Planctomycetales bacterium]|nr:hypothetical protein [Planctomycetales bacterium]